MNVSSKFVLAVLVTVVSGGGLNQAYGDTYDCSFCRDDHRGICLAECAEDEACLDECIDRSCVTACAPAPSPSQNPSEAAVETQEGASEMKAPQPEASQGSTM